MGTLPYMSPEQLEGDAIDHRTDLWAVGIMLYEMVTGTHPVIHDGAQPPARPCSTSPRSSCRCPASASAAPDLGPLAGIIDRCLIKDRAHRTRDAHVLLRELEALSAGRRVAVLGDDGNPFAGLAPFQEADADRFFGRAREVGAVLARLRSCPLIALAGPSGVGKSSLVRAGVIPQLKRSGEGWDALILRPGRSPLAALSRHPGRAGALGHRSAAAARERARRRRAARPTARRATCARRPASSAPRCARGPTASGAACWCSWISSRSCTRCAPIPTSAPRSWPASTAWPTTRARRLRVLLSIRSDFLDRLAEHRHLADAIGHGLMLVPPLDREGLRDALVRPVEAADYRYEDAAHHRRHARRRRRRAGQPAAAPVRGGPAVDRARPRAPPAHPGQLPGHGRDRRDPRRARRPRAGRPSPAASGRWCGPSSSAWSRPSAPAPW